MAGALSAVTVVVVDDHGALRRGVRDVLEGAGAVVAAEVGDAASGLEAVREHRPDVVLLDLKLPDRPGIEVLPAILEAAPTARVLVFTVSREAPDVALAFSLGARGFIGKDSAPRALVSAVSTVMAGDLVIGAPFEDVVRELARRAAGPQSDGSAPVELTARQEEILVLLARGLSNRDIARVLSLSSGTVKRHVTEVLEAVGVENRVQAAVWAVDAGLR